MDPNAADMISKLQKQLDELRRELAELRRLLEARDVEQPPKNAYISG